MSAGPREQTAAILREHSGTFVDQEGDTRCECGKWLEPGEHEWDWHVAGLVVEALGLTEEWGATCDAWKGGRTVRKTREAAEDDADTASMGDRSPLEPRPPSRDEMRIERRWVSGWSVVGGEPSE